MEQHGQVPKHQRLARAADVPQVVVEPLPAGLRERVEQRLSHHLAPVPDDLLVRAVHELEHVVGAAEDGEKRWRLAEDRLQMRVLDLHRPEQRLPLPLGLNPWGGLRADDECAADGAVVVVDRAIAVRPVHLLQAPIPHDGDEVVFVPRRLPARHHPLDLRADDGPDVRPELRATHSQRPRVAPTLPERRTVGVVVDLDQVSPPPEEHRVPRGEHDADGGAQARGPALDGPERGGGPVEGTTPRGHLAVADEDRAERPGRVSARHAKPCDLPHLCGDRRQLTVRRPNGKRRASERQAKGGAPTGRACGVIGSLVHHRSLAPHDPWF